MYINPFVAGVIATVLVELALIMMAACVKAVKKNYGGKNNG